MEDAHRTSLTARIDNDKKIINQKSSTQSLKSYVSKVCRESTIAIISNIVSTNSRTRKICMTFVLFSCITGFLYQFTTFMNHVFEYPTTINLQVRAMEKVPNPAYTFCENNMVKRSLFCSKNPSYCFKPSEEYCSKYDGYCKDNKKLGLGEMFELEKGPVNFRLRIPQLSRKQDKVPKPRYLNKDLPFAANEFLSMAGNFDDFVVSYDLRFSNMSLRRGPFIRADNVGQTWRKVSKCYSLNSATDGTRLPDEKNIKDVKRYISRGQLWIAKFLFFIDSDEIFDPQDKPGLFFSVHSPYTDKNPFENGILMKPGKEYKLFLTVTEEHFLKEPYHTNCTDYHEIWTEKDPLHTQKEPLSKQMCLYKCEYDHDMFEHNCTRKSGLYPSENVCRLDFNYYAINPSLSESNRENLFQCVERCKQDCKKLDYKLSVRERDMDNRNSGLRDKYHKYIRVQIYVEDFEIVTRIHAPKYIGVEIFSAVGGFIGCWLGISFMDISDLLIRFLMIIKYAFRKKKDDKDSRDQNWRDTLLNQQHTPPKREENVEEDA